MAPVEWIRVSSGSDVELTRHQARHLAVSVGFGSEAVEEIVLAVSELAMNLLRYARNGRIALSVLARPSAAGVQIESRDDGPGIGDVAWAMRDGTSSGLSLGSGLPAIRRLMDEFVLSSNAAGTTVTIRKWVSIE